jgi:DNA-binding XRE family transcriptional regulator
MSKVREVIDAYLNPIRKNDLEARRRKLGLSRVALGRILEVDPATVFRRERGPFVPLWDYALRGIEAEAADKSSKRVVQHFKSQLDRETFIPDQLDAQGYAYTAAKMHEARRQHALGKSRSAKPSLSDKRPGQTPASRATSGERRTGQLSKDRIKQIADRAEGLKD